MCDSAESRQSVVRNNEGVGRVMSLARRRRLPGMVTSAVVAAAVVSAAVVAAAVVSAAVVAAAVVSAAVVAAAVVSAAVVAAAVVSAAVVAAAAGAGDNTLCGTRVLETRQLRQPFRM